MWTNQQWQAKKREWLGAVEIDNDLSRVMNVDYEGEAHAVESGLSGQPIDQIWEAVEGLYETGMYPGLSFCLRKNGKLVLNRSLGLAELGEGDKPGRELTVDTPICLYSASKAITAMAIHKLAEQGKVKLLDPVSHYLPEFGQKGKSEISIYQLLAHRGGFPRLEGEIAPESIFARDEILQRIYETEALCDQGRVQAYHAITAGFICDELVRVTTGKDINAYVQQVFAKPMGMKYFRYGLNKRQLKLAATNYNTGIKNPKLVDQALEKALGASVSQATEISNSEAFKTNIIPAANLYATAEETSRFFQMLIDEGRYQGKQIMQPVTIRKAVREADKARFDKGIFLPLRFSAGFMLGGAPLGLYGLNTGQAFGHLGFSNIFCWADPERDISVALLTTGKPIIGSHILALPKLMHQISKVCR